jgi:hypothetical protein
MMSEGASQSLMKIEAVETAIIPMERKIRRRITMGLTLPQLPLLFKPFDEEVNLQRNRISLSSLAFPHFILPSP